MTHPHEASNILRRLTAVIKMLDTRFLGQAQKAARTLKPEDIRVLVRMLEYYREPRSGPLVAKVIRGGEKPPSPPLTPVNELRGIARSIIRYGGPDAVRRDAEGR